MQDIIPRLKTWNASGQTQTAGTAILIPIPPYPGPPNNAPFYYQIDQSGRPNWWQMGAMTHVSNLSITASSTPHQNIFMRPVNFTTVAAAAAKGATAITIAADPGLYSVNYRYALPGAQAYPVAAADAGIAANDYFAVQLVDGLWWFSKVTSVAGLVLTVPALPSPTPAGNVLAAGAIFFLFKTPTSVDPNPCWGQAHPAVTPGISLYSVISDQAGDGIVATLNPGDPMYFFNANATGADTVTMISGYYGGKV